ncbi:MAG: ABC transporter ATP-binding protein [bacterium]|nr:ABC transporter ATP-binding protein [bacterium]
MFAESTRTPETTDRQILDRYTDQPASMPRPVRRAIEDAWDGAPVQLYALADLDGSLKLTESWVALGPRHVSIARGIGGALDVQTFARESIQAMRLDPGLTCNTLRFLGEPGQPALARVRFTHRQRRAMESVQFVIERALDGSPVAFSADADGEYADNVAGPIREAQALVAGNDLAVVWRLLGYLRPYRGKVIFGMASAGVLTALSLVPPYLTGYLVDEVIRPVQDGVKTVAEVQQVAWVAVGVIAASYILRQLAAWARLRWMAVLGEHVARDLRTELYEHLQKLSLSFYSRKKTGSLITRVTADTDRLWEFLALGIVDVSLSLVMLAGLSAVLIHLDWKLGLVMTLPVPFLCVWVYIHGRRMNRLFLRAWRKWSAVTDIVSDTIPGMKVVKAFHQEVREKERFGARNHNVTNEFNRIHEVWTSFWPALMLAVRGMVVLVWVLALPRVLPGDSGLAASLTSGTFVAFLLYMTMFVQPIEIIGQMARIMNRATSSAHRIFEVLDTEPQVVDKGCSVRLEPLEGKVEFENVTFGYDGVRQVAQGISFAVEPGEMIGLVGPSGGGKTTVTNLLARFYDVTGGSVRIDGVDVRQLDTGCFRQQLGMVLQDPYLFHGTVMENIRYGLPDAAVDEVVEAAITANAHDFLCKLPSGYETMVGERGQTLSGGERQRISIARAILHDPRILVLDEATSSVDTETEFKIQEALDRLTSGRTVFAIAHRLSTLRRADRILVIEDGRISESGSPTELLQKPGGTFQHLWHLQQQLQG